MCACREILFKHHKHMNPPPSSLVHRKQTSYVSVCVCFIFKQFMVAWWCMFAFFSLSLSSIINLCTCSSHHYYHHHHHHHHHSRSRFSFSLSLSFFLSLTCLMHVQTNTPTIRAVPIAQFIISIQLVSSALSAVVLQYLSECVCVCVWKFLYLSLIYSKSLK